MRIRVGIVGRGAMGLEATSNLLRDDKYDVKVLDIGNEETAELSRRAGSFCDSLHALATSSRFLICMTSTAQEVDDVLFNANTSVLKVLPPNSTVLICSTVSPRYIDSLASRIVEAGRSDMQIVDFLVFKEASRAADSAFTVLASGTEQGLGLAKNLLSAMAGKLHIVPGGIGAASKLNLINKHLVGTHVAAAAEAIGLATRMSLDTHAVFNIISKAAGSSWAFENRGPSMLARDWTPLSTTNIQVQDMDVVTSTAKELSFPFYLGSVAEQLYLSATAHGYGQEDDSSIVRLFLQGKDTHSSPKIASSVSATENPTISPSVPLVEKVAIIGLGAMGQGMATTLVKHGLTVHGYDIYEPSVRRFATSGEKAYGATSPADAAIGAEVLLLVVQNAAQARDALLGAGKAAHALPRGATVILSSTVPPSFLSELEKDLAALGRDISLIDAPISGGAARAASGDLLILYSGDESTISKTRNVLDSLTGRPENLCLVHGALGAASSVKMINQLLAGVHIATAAEAMAFAAHLGLDTKYVYDVIKGAPGWSWMLENRVPQMLQADWTPYSSVAIFVKDLGIVLGEAKKLSYSAPITSAAYNLYVAGASRGWSREADAGIVRLWETKTVTVANTVVGNAGPAREKIGLAPPPTMSTNTS